MPTIRGSCLCGGVKFEIDGVLQRPLNCHCSRCRKQHGAAFRSRVRVRVADFKWIQGEDLVSYYEILSAGFAAVSAAFAARRWSTGRVPPTNRPWKIQRLPRSWASRWAFWMMIRASAPSAMCFVASKAPWFEITDDLPQYPDYPPPAKTAAGRGTALGRRGCEDGRVRRSGAAAETPCRGSAGRRDRRRI